MEYGKRTCKAGAEGTQKEVSFLTFVDIGYAEHKCPPAYKNTQVYWTVFCWMKNLTFSNSIHLFLSSFPSSAQKMSQSLSLGWACHVFLCLKFWFPRSEVNIIKWQKYSHIFNQNCSKFIYNITMGLLNVTITWKAKWKVEIREGLRLFLTRFSPTSIFFDFPGPP